MKIKGQYGWKGHIEITVYDRDGHIKRITRLENQIKNVGLNMMRDFLKGDVSNGDIKYLAWGSSNTANSASQTQLGAEFGRKAITSQAAGSTGVLTSTTYVGPDEATSATIEELGWFAGASATGTANSGILVARVLYSRAKTALESINVVRTDTIVEAV